MGSKVGQRKLSENRGQDFSSNLTFEFDASSQRIFQYVDLGSGLGVSMQKYSSTINPNQLMQSLHLSSALDAWTAPWIRNPPKSFVSGAYTQQTTEREIKDSVFELNHNSPFTVICVLQWANNSNEYRHGFLANSFNNKGWALYPESANKITFVLFNDLYFGDRRCYAGTAISWGDYGQTYFSGQAGPFVSTNATSSFGQTYILTWQNSNIFEFTSPATIFPLQKSTTYRFVPYVSQLKADLQTSTGTTVLVGPLVIGNNGWRNNGYNFTASWYPGTGSSITHWNAGKANLSDNVDFGYSQGTAGGGVARFSLNHRRWLHYAITYTGTPPTTIAGVESAFKIYLQGAAVGTSAENSANLNITSNMTYDSGSRFRFFMEKSDSGNNAGVTANIGFCQIYNRVLSDTEISTQYNSIKNRFGLP
jgi:hypothetical protein